jgi:hypothetical protein
LSLADEEGVRQLLSSTLAPEDGLASLANTLKLMAGGAEHDLLISILFSMIRENLSLLRSIMGAMQIATSKA